MFLRFLLWIFRFSKTISFETSFLKILKNDHRSSEPKPHPLLLKSTLNKGVGSGVELRFGADLDDFGPPSAHFASVTPENLRFFFARLGGPILTKIAPKKRKDRALQARKKWYIGVENSSKIHCIPPKSEKKWSPEAAWAQILDLKIRDSLNKCGFRVGGGGSARNSGDIAQLRSKNDVKNDIWNIWSRLQPVFGELHGREEKWR